MWHPHRGHYHYWHRHWHRGPSRILWFVLGAAAATWWGKHRERLGYPANRHCVRPPIPEPALSTQVDPNDTWSARGMSKALNSIPPMEMTDEEKRRLAEFSAYAGDKLAEVSEVTLDTVLAAVEALRAKLVAHRAEREKQKALEEQHRKDNTP